VLLQVKYGSYPLRHVREIGSRLPALKTAMGHALLARLSDEALETRFAATGEFASVPSELRPRLLAIRRRGFVVATSVLTPGITTIAAALVDPATRDSIAIALAFPDSAADRQLQRRMSEVLLSKATEVGRRIEDPGWQAAGSRRIDRPERKR